MMNATCLDHAAEVPSGYAYPTSPSGSNDSKNFKGFKDTRKSDGPQTLRFTSTEHYFQAGMERPLSVTGQCSKRGYLLDAHLRLGACGLMGLFLCMLSSPMYILWDHSSSSSLLLERS